MLKLYISLFLLLPGIVVPHTIRADDDLNLPDLSSPDDTQWRETTPSMSTEAYKQAYDYNRRLLRRALTQYLESKFTSLGVSETTFRLTEGALFLAFKHDAEFNLNESKTMALEFSDLTDEDRAMLYKFKFNW